MNANDIDLIEIKFFRYFPNSRAERPFNQARARAALRHIENYENINNAEKAFTQEELKELNLLTKRRRINSFYKLPKTYRTKLETFIIAYETYYNLKIEKLYLTGSFVEGHWRTGKEKNKRLLELIYKIKGKKGVSDIDVFPLPLKSGFSIGRVQVHSQAWEKVLIYENGKFI